MIIDCKSGDFDNGAYGHVFFINEKTMAIKVFSKDHNIEQATKVFDAEVDAYKSATKHHDIINFLPKFYGVQKITKIVINGNDETSHFHVSLAYKISFEAGYFQKINSNNVSKLSKNRVISNFHKIGVMHVNDASVTIDNDGNILKIIDFATKEFQM